MGKDEEARLRDRERLLMDASTISSYRILADSFQRSRAYSAPFASRMILPEGL